MAKLRSSLSIQMWCGDHPGRSCAVSASDTNSTLISHQMAVPGLKIHAESSSNGSSRPASHTSERGTTRTSWRFSSPARREDQGTERAAVNFVMDVVAGARRTLSGALNVLRLRSALPEALRRHFLRAVTAAVFSSHVAPATLASCRGTSQQNIAFQMFLQFPTFRRHVSRPVAAGV